ncbi:MAG: IS1182 family transposase [Gammaproteobacteria bacterium]|nr:IS1182 family transposase [Gammaproteobacteria bacterium]
MSCADRTREDTRPRIIERLIGPEHPARIVWEFVEGLDLSLLYGQVKSVEGVAGRPAIDAKILMAVWLYGIVYGETSARRLEELCNSHSAFIWLCGGVNINHHTLSDFFVGNEQWLEEQFTYYVAVLMKEGLVDLSRVAQDGMRVRANAGAASFRREKTLEECLEDAKERVDAARKEREENPAQTDKRKQAAQERATRERKKRVTEALRQLPEVKEKKKEQDKEKARVSTTDPDTRVMKMADGGFRPAFNAQIATDTDSQIIAQVEVVNEGSDQGQLSSMMDRIEGSYGKYPDESLVDGGFNKQEEIETCTAKGITVYAPVPKPKDKNRNPYEPMPKDSEAVANWRKRMGTDEAKEIYKQRASTAECVNAIARNRGLWQFTVRGLRKVKTVLVWFALAHNVMRAASLRLKAA